MRWNRGSNRRPRDQPKGTVNAFPIHQLAHNRRFQVGQRVICATGRGAWSEHVVASASHVVPMPDGMSFEEGAAIPVNYGTAYLMLFRCAHLKEGQSVLIHMAAGGVVSGLSITSKKKNRGRGDWFFFSSPFQGHRCDSACQIGSQCDSVWNRICFEGK